MKTEINVSMNGKDYIKYLDSRKTNWNFSKSTKKALPYFIGSFLLFIVAVVLLINLQPKEEVKPVFDTWYQVMNDRSDYSWNAILKVGVVYVFPFAVTAILLSWLIHGVGFVIVRR
jgi:ABC-type multidrug transport system permease subunit